MEHVGTATSFLNFVVSLNGVYKVITEHLKGDSTDKQHTDKLLQQLGNRLEEIKNEIEKCVGVNFLNVVAYSEHETVLKSALFDFIVFSKQQKEKKETAKSSTAGYYLPSFIFRSKKDDGESVDDFWRKKTEDLKRSLLCYLGGLCGENQNAPDILQTITIQCKVFVKIINLQIRYFFLL